MQMNKRICAGLYILLSGFLLCAQDLTVKPEKYLRGWDPVTIDLGRDMGPASGGPLDEPGDLFQLWPAHPGEYRWIDSRRIEFRPAVVWPPLKEYEVVSLGRVVRLSTMLTPPTRLSPSPSMGNEPLSEFTLYFPYPVESGALADMVSLSVRPLPGVGDEGLKVLSSEDFTVKPLNELAGSGAYSYLLRLKDPIGYGRPGGGEGGGGHVFEFSLKQG
jgi:hypothetical protein